MYKLALPFFMMTGSRCEVNINECDPNPCQWGGHCRDGVANHSCLCLTGYKGVNCEHFSKFKFYLNHSSLLTYRILYVEGRNYRVMKMMTSTCFNVKMLFYLPPVVTTNSGELQDKHETYDLEENDFDLQDSSSSNSSTVYVMSGCVVAAAVLVIKVMCCYRSLPMCHNCRVNCCIKLGFWYTRHAR